MAEFLRRKLMPLEKQLKAAQSESKTKSKGSEWRRASLPLWSVVTMSLPPLSSS